MVVFRTNNNLRDDHLNPCFFATASRMIVTLTRTFEKLLDVVDVLRLTNSIGHTCSLCPRYQAMLVVFVGEHSLGAYKFPRLRPFRGLVDAGRFRPRTSTFMASCHAAWISIVLHPLQNEGEVLRLQGFILSVCLPTAPPATIAAAPFAVRHVCVESRLDTGHS